MREGGGVLQAAKSKGYRFLILTLDGLVKAAQSSTLAEDGVPAKESVTSIFESPSSRRGEGGGCEGAVECAQFACGNYNVRWATPSSGVGCRWLPLKRGNQHGVVKKISGKRPVIT